MKKIIGSLGFASTMLVSSMASAALVTEWDFNAVTVFAGSTFKNGAELLTNIDRADLVSWGANVGAIANETRHLEAGASPSAARSAVAMTAGNVVGVLETNAAEAEFSGQVTHYNNALAAGFATLLSTTINSTLFLTPKVPVGAPFAPLPKSFEVKFTETTNTSTVGACGFDSVTPCDDIFVITLGDLDFSFDYEGYRYTVGIVADGLGPLSPEACAKAAADPGCIGFKTPENEFTPVNFGLLISARSLEVPEPSALALLGLGLVGLGFAGRRKTA